MPRHNDATQMPWTRRRAARKARRAQKLNPCFVGLESLEVRLLLHAGPHGDIGTFPPPDPSYVYNPLSDETIQPRNPQGSDVPAGSLVPPAGDENLFPLDQTFFLHSNPGATKVIYLDFDGHTTTGTRWNDAFPNGNGPGGSIYTPPYSLDGDVNNFSDTELRAIQTIWQRTAEDFLPFDVDVTTEDPGVANLVNSGFGDSRWGARAAIGGSDSDWFQQGAGGVAYVGSFDDNQDDPAFIFAADFGGNPPDVNLVISHEVGHNVNLNHDGLQRDSNPVIAPNEDYYGGHGTGATSWGPIMGAPYGRQVTQWSQGEYTNATRGIGTDGNDADYEDDLLIITTQNGFGYRLDDHPNTNAEASAESNFLQFNESFDVEDEGIIERNTDVDVFMFFLDEEGGVSLQIMPFYLNPNLDILATLYREGETDPVAISDPQDRLDAFFDSLTLPEGTYFLHVDGTGTGNPFAAQPTGYTDYGSLGYYSITGNLDFRTPKPTAVDLLPQSDTGISNEDNITYLDNSNAVQGPGDKRLTFSVTGTIPGATVNLYAQFADEEPALLGSIVATDTTTIVTTFGTLDLNEGVNIITARQTLPEVPQSRASEPLPVTIDTIAPAVPALPDLDAASDTGISNSDNVTRINRPKITALAAHAPGEIVEFHVDGTLNGTIFNSLIQGGQRLYTHVTDTLPDGPRNVTARATDIAGNLSGFSPTLVVQVDTVGPVATIASVTPSPRNIRLDAMSLTFDAQVYGFSLSNLTLKRNNGSNLLSGEQTVTTSDSTSWALNNLENVTQPSGNYTLAVVAPAAATDLAGNPITALVTHTFIVELPRVSISDVTLYESAGVFEFTVSLSSAIPEASTVNYAVNSGSAVAGADYQSIAGTLTFAAGAVSQTIAVNIVDDEIVEENEIFFVNLSGVSSNLSLFKPTGIGTILNEDLPFATLTVPDANAFETGVDPGVFTVTRNGPTGSPLTVQYKVSGTAAPGSDYQALTGSVVIPVGHSSANITVRPIDDDAYELAETVVIDLLEVEASYKVPDQTPRTVTIHDNDLPMVTLLASDPNAAERGQDPGHFTFTRSGPTVLPLTVSYAVAGAATPGTDYNAIASTITFPPGQSQLTLTITPVDDFNLEPDESVVLSLAEDPGYRKGLNSGGTVLIDNREIPTVELGVSPSQVPIAYEQNRLSAEFLLRRTSPLDDPLTVFYTVAGTATNGEDYLPIPTSITLVPGQSTAIIRIQPFDDFEYELDELVTLTLVPHPSYLSGATTSGTVTLVDNDGAITEFGGPDRKKSKLTYIDADGDKVTLKLSGPGRGKLYRGFGANDALRIELTGTSSASSLTIKGGQTTLRQLDVQGGLKKLNAKNVSILEEVSSLGPIYNIRAKQLGGQLEMGTLGASASQAVSLNVADAMSLNVLSAVPFKSIKASDWSSTDPSGTQFIAPWIGRMKVLGDFNSDLNLTGAGAGGDTLGKTSIGGLLGSRTGDMVNWSIAGDAPTIEAGAVSNLDIDVLGEFNGVRIK